eukprot:TRINITY_DN7092_c0_g2_i6.p2 TRINITY_DN7092_c0_g2~~TRINITY_DN7092_c0_g2_i6.p2  ORF type:complete len:233 (+),score=79.19 TRINITY_DN7092_c0_g2_i6:77-775(+)
MCIRDRYMGLSKMLEGFTRWICNWTLLICRVMIPVYMSQRIHAKKREEPGAAERALKFWIINALLFFTDMLESWLYKYLFDSEYFYCTYLILKSGLYLLLLSNNFQNAASLYDATILKILPSIQPQIDFIVSKISSGTGYVTTKVTPGLANTLAEQTKSVMFFMGAKLVSMLEFKAAITEPQKQQLSRQPEANRMAMSLMADNPGELFGEKKPADVNSTQVVGKMNKGDTVI